VTHRGKLPRTLQEIHLSQVKEVTSKSLALSLRDQPPAHPLPAWLHQEIHTQNTQASLFFSVKQNVIVAFTEKKGVKEASALGFYFKFWNQINDPHNHT
jgi:hypothetical protein